MINLIQDDCISVMNEMIEHGMSVDFCFTSPPYNRKRNDKYEYFNDSNNSWFDWMLEVIDKNLEIGEYLFLNLQKNYYNKKDVFKIIGNYSNEIIDIICWTKSNPMPASGFNITNSYEFILIMSKKNKSIKAKKTYTVNRIETSVYSNNPYKKVHRAVMKPEVVQWFIERFTDKKDVIFDCFMGVGTTGVECKKNGRDFIGVEMNQIYFDICKERIGANTND